MQNFEKIILNYFGSEPGGRLKIKQLAKTLDINPGDYPEFRDTVKALAHKGKLYRYKGNNYGISDMKGEITGTLDMHPRGFAFVHTPDAQKIFIPEDGLANAAHGDTVAVVIHRKQKQSRDPEGHIKRVITRGKNEFICTFQTLRGYTLGIPASHHLRSEIIIDDMNGISPLDGDYIIVEITHWQPGKERHRGRIKRLVGKDSVPEFDAVMVANKHSIPVTFSPETLKQVQNMQFETSFEPERKDLRDLLCFTIDPEDAKDYDDAVSIEITKEGHYLLGVHIADVSHYVTAGTPLDTDALQRGTSVYFTDHVIHMLPEKLSTDLCSLQPDTDRLAMTVLITIAKNGECLSYEIMPSVIHSRKRFTYEEVQEILDLHAGPFHKELSGMSNLAKLLKKRRNEEGSIDFDLPEPVYDLDENGVPLSIKVRERIWSHHIVEEFMLLANQCVAKYARKRGTNIPFIYRIHDIPEADSMYEWFALMDAFGLQVSFFGLPITSKKFQNALEKVMKQNDSTTIRKMALRTMTKAKYSVKPIGHFGLAFEDYTHFTSPIRRYPDLIVHRLLKYYLSGQSIPPEINKRLKYIAKASSAAELRALEAEREYHKLKQVRYILRHVGETFDGTISGVAPHGFWVELRDIFVEGFVRSDALGSDIWDFDKRRQILKGFHTKKTYRIGDPLRVQILRADIKNQRIDLEPVKEMKKTT